MSQDDLLTHARRQPFVPFTIVLTTGTTYDIQHPELIMVGGREAIVGLTDDPMRTTFDRTAFVDLFHIVEVRTSTPATPTGSNGQQPPAAGGSPE